MEDFIIHFHKYSANIKVNKHISVSGNILLKSSVERKEISE